MGPVSTFSLILFSKLVAPDLSLFDSMIMRTTKSLSKHCLIFLQLISYNDK